MPGGGRNAGRGGAGVHVPAPTTDGAMMVWDADRGVYVAAKPCVDDEARIMIFDNGDVVYFEVP